MVLRVKDQALMVKFYCNVLGCLVERKSDNGALHQLRAGTSLIDLVTISDAKEVKSAAKSNTKYHNMDHFCVRIELISSERVVGSPAGSWHKARSGGKPLRGGRIRPVYIHK